MSEFLNSETSSSLTPYYSYELAKPICSTSQYEYRKNNDSARHAAHAPAWKIWELKFRIWMKETHENSMNVFSGRWSALDLVIIVLNDGAAGWLSVTESNDHMGDAKNWIYENMCNISIMTFGIYENMCNRFTVLFGIFIYCWHIK